MKKILLTLFLILSASTSSFAQEGLQKIRINDFSGGINSYDLPDILQPNQGTSVVNVVLSRLGILSKRKGQRLFNPDVGSTAFTGVGTYDPDQNTALMAVASGTDIITSTTTASAWTVINPASPQTAGKDTQFVQANDLLFILNGFDSTSYYNGTNFVKTLVYPTSPPSATTGAWLRNYLFLSGATTEDDWVYFSNNANPQVFSDGDIVKISTGDGQSVLRLEPFRLNELVIYKEESIYILDITGNTPLIDWTVQPISNSIGTIASRSVVNLGNDQWFLSSEPIAIRSLARTQFDKILLGFVSQPIQDIFDGSGAVTINRTQADKSAAVLFDNKYILAIPTGTSLVNNTVVVYDFLRESWYRIEGWFPRDWIIFDDRLFYTDANDGRVFEVFVDTGGDFSQGPNFIDFASSPDVGINFQYISKAIDFGNSENYKQLDSIEVELSAVGNYNAEVFINMDNTGWQKIGDVNMSGSGVSLPVTLPFTLSNDGIVRKTFQARQYFGENARGEFKNLLIKVSQSGIGQSITLRRITVFADIKQRRRI